MAPRVSEEFVTYNDIFEVLLMGLLVNPRVHDLSLFRLKGRDLLLREVWDVPVRSLLLRSML
jgi:hypothetical protein